VGSGLVYRPVAMTDTWTIPLEFMEPIPGAPVFGGVPRLEFIDGKDWLLSNDVWYRDALGNTYKMTARTIGGRPQRFVTDGGTIPPWAWPIVGHPMDDLFPAYLLHDWLWAHRPGDMTMEQTNDRLNESLRVMGCKTWRREAIMIAVYSPTARRMWRDVKPLEYHYAPCREG